MAHALVLTDADALLARARTGDLEALEHVYRAGAAYVAAVLVIGLASFRSRDFQ